MVHTRRLPGLVVYGKSSLPASSVAVTSGACISATAGSKYERFSNSQASRCLVPVPRGTGACAVAGRGQATVAAKTAMAATKKFLIVRIDPPVRYYVKKRSSARVRTGLTRQRHRQNGRPGAGRQRDRPSVSG